MGFIFVIIGAMLLLDLVWWGVSSRLVGRGPWKTLASVWALAQLCILIWLISGRFAGNGWDRLIPKPLASLTFLWHFFGLALFLIIGVGAIFWKMMKWGRSRFAPANAAATDREISISRRQFAGIMAAMAPPVFTIGATGIAMAQLNHFRVRRFEIPLPGLPRALDGITIVHVSDIHVGRFTSGRVLKEMVRVTNELSADLLFLTGDLINDALADLSSALDIARAMEGRHGRWMIEGNHDLIEDGAEFERRARLSGIPFLKNESAMVTIRGVPLQILGLAWTQGHGKNHDAAISASVRDLLLQRREDAFPILLAHHPHAFDAATAAGIPLVLSGHTHGGQLMLNEQTGFGPAIFRYWSGLYKNSESRMIVSNGVGNWFPLRVNAPAEIVHITLRCETA